MLVSTEGWLHRRPTESTGDKANNQCTLQLFVTAILHHYRTSFTYWGLGRTLQPRFGCEIRCKSGAPAIEVGYSRSTTMSAAGGPSSPVRLPLNQKVCPHWQKGKCWYGDRCKFKHVNGHVESSGERQGPVVLSRFTIFKFLNQLLTGS